MPYGIPKKYGGDNPQNIRRMEKCVERVMAQGKTKVQAIRICKSTLFSMNTSTRKKKRRRKKKHGK